MSKKAHRTQKPKDASRHYTSELVRCDYVSGRDLSRFMVLEWIDENTMRCLVRRLAGLELENRCDACVRRHSFVNPRCSMNRADRWRPGPAFYTFRGRKPLVGNWRQVDSAWRNNNIGEETWTRTAARAGTQSGAFMQPTV